MISRLYISHSEHDVGLALEISQALWRVGLESYAAMYNLAPGISRTERVSFGIRNSECLVALLTIESAMSPTVNQEIGLARGIDLLTIPILEKGAQLPFLIEHLKAISFSPNELKDAIGISEEQLREAAKSAVCKINIDSDGRLAMTAAVRKVLDEKPEEFDPRKYLGPARDSLKELYKHKNIHVLGSNDQA